MAAKKKTEKVAEKVVTEPKKVVEKVEKVADTEPKPAKKSKATPAPLTIEEVAQQQVEDTKRKLEEFYIRTNQKGALAQLRASK
ncbi:hypothetical protein [Herbiconiux daphne]|uniref:Uncharacterized protein n=1 Tax=Herbiconiux daphne TaxID=2970914 RepID=A0ABT2HCC6_9MICO|nr:hypothetical protein [Herbiconiux daphne]MCS5737596.1 hypothetical protein [Herbiconiux daphne]